MAIMYYAVRGATTIVEDTKDNVLEATTEMLKEIIEKNEIDVADIESIEFTATKDICTAYPAVAARGLGITKAGLMCMQEMYVEGSLQRCIRVLMRVRGDKPQASVVHIYLKEAIKLRPDLASKPEEGVNSLKISIAIDGTGGVGKSTLAKHISETLKIIYVDTGAMYRAVALYCINNSINTTHEQLVVNALAKVQLSFKHKRGEQLIYLQHEDVTTDIRTQEVAKISSIVAKYPKVREKMVAIQQKIALEKSVVMDGRDIGSVVLPNATIKIYMTAKAVERTKRRVGELKEKGIEADFDEVLEEIIVRDYNDKNRECSPLIKTEDAIVFDTSDMTLEEAKLKIITLLRENKIY